MSPTHYLSSLFAPQSIAVVGASEREHSVAGAIFANILNGGFRGRLHAVNPKHATVFAQPAVATLEEIGARVDLAIIATPARSVPALIEQCARAGIGNALIVAGGFAESGASGAQMCIRDRGKLAAGESDAACKRIELNSAVIEQGKMGGKPYRIEATEDYVLELRNGEWLATRASTSQR